MKQDIVIIFGGNSCEHDVSIITAVQTMNAINFKNFNVIPLYLKDNKFYSGDELFDIEFYKTRTMKKLKECAFVGQDLFFIQKKKLKHCCFVYCAMLCTHGGGGEDGCLQGFLEINNIPYTSAKVTESACCMDKCLTKILLNYYKIPTVKGMAVYPRKENLTEIEFKIKKLNYPLILKPSKLGSSIGIAVVNNLTELNEKLNFAVLFDDKILVEEKLADCYEINCGVTKIDNQIVLSEIERPMTSGEILTFSDKYISSSGKGMKSQKRDIKPEIPVNVHQEILNLSGKAFEKLNLDGIVRIDFLVKDEKVYLNEINTIPGSMAFYLFAEKGIKFADLIEKNIRQAVSSKAEKDKLKTTFQSNILGENPVIKNKNM